eukprot:Gregarina_sp_Poly_1__1343@NODE_1332_length_4355_cov_250_381530_g896_i0_p2_GENE_NODE_1332_length_4355_cov_250_381530_g896_i0NODE_1332_length_4355_cov_250_381530_g896_i0_p2_ORF_typecomplete_len187_score22_75CAP_GLY/PF01302_25/5_2e09_NODE_1332_length_4355_cov_250_381530_g896_i036434203
MGVTDGMRIHIYDGDPNSIIAELERTEGALATGIKKFELTDEEYAKKPGTARQFLSKLKMQRPDLFKEGPGSSVSTESKADFESMPFKLGSRCEIKGTHLRGKVAWIGTISHGLQQKYVATEFKPKTNMYCGVALDDPVGNFNGTDLDGTVLFECDCSRRGMLVHVDDLDVNDAYVPLDPFDLDEI